LPKVVKVSKVNDLKDNDQKDNKVNDLKDNDQRDNKVNDLKDNDQRDNKVNDLSSIQRTSSNALKNPTRTKMAKSPKTNFQNKCSECSPASIQTKMVRSTVKN
jgi:hypothetical protein